MIGYRRCCWYFFFWVAFLLGVIGFFGVWFVSYDSKVGIDTLMSLSIYIYTQRRHLLFLALLYCVNAVDLLVWKPGNDWKVKDGFVSRSIAAADSDSDLRILLYDRYTFFTSSSQPSTLASSEKKRKKEIQVIQTFRSLTACVLYTLSSFIYDTV